MINSLDCWTSYVSVSRPCDAMTSLRHLFPQPYSRHQDPTSWPCWALCCLHQIPGWINDRYSPAAVIKGNPLPRTTDAKPPFPSELGIITIFVLLPASLGYTATRVSLPSTSFFPSKLFSVFVPDVEEKLRADRKKNSSQAATHDSIFGRVRVVSLDVNRDVSLYRRRIMSAISRACAHSSSASSWTAMR
jgi:hypothetical protein